MGGRLPGLRFWNDLVLTLLRVSHGFRCYIVIIYDVSTLLTTAVPTINGELFSSLHNSDSLMQLVLQIGTVQPITHRYIHAFNHRSWLTCAAVNLTLTFAVSPTNLVVQRMSHLIMSEQASGSLH